MYNKIIMEKIGQIILFIYGAIAMVMTVYYNWEYANTNGFFAWLFFGEIIATFKGFLWPIFVFF